MITRSMTFLVSMVVATTIGYVLLKAVAPGAAAKIDAYTRDHVTGWDEDACQADAVGCLTSRYAELRRIAGKLEVSIRSLQTELGRIGAARSDHEMLLAKNTAYIAEGDALLDNSKLGSDAPIAFAGQRYPGAKHISAQLKLLRSENQSLSKSIDDARVLEIKLREKLDALLVTRGEVALAKQTLPAKIELVKANVTLNDLTESVDIANRVIAATEGGMKDAEHILGTTKDLLLRESLGRDNVPSRTEH